MTQSRLIMRSAAIAALLSVAGCAHDHGRVAFSSGAGAPSGGGGGSGSGGSGSFASPDVGEAVGGGAGPVLATAGNLVDGALSGDPDAAGALDPLARVTVDGETLTGNPNGAEQPALGVNVASDGQTQGQLATLGVLNNGQVVAANTVGPAGNGDLIGANVNDEQVIGQGPTQQIGLGVLSPAQTDGGAASVNVLTNGDTLGVQVPNATTGQAGNGDVVQGLTDTLGNVLNGG